MLETINELYDYFITFASLSLLLVALFYWIVLSIDRKQQKDFDTKYRESRNNNERSETDILGLDIRKDKTFLLRIPPRLHELAKIKAHGSKMPLHDFIITALKEKVLTD